MKRMGIGLVIIGVLISVFLILNRPAKAFSIFGLKLSFSSSQSTTTTDNGNTTSMHSSSSYTYDSSDPKSNDPCLKFKNHEYEVCTAYIANSAIADLVPYYSFVHSDESFMKDFATSRLGSRFTGQAQQVITDRTSSWPAGDLDVGVPKITILSDDSNLAANTATLTTMESWSVKTDSGQTIYSENHTHHTIVMHRVPSYVLHKWVVTEIH